MTSLDSTCLRGSCNTIMKSTIFRHGFHRHDILIAADVWVITFILLLLVSVNTYKLIPMHLKFIHCIYTDFYSGYLLIWGLNSSIQYCLAAKSEYKKGCDCHYWWWPWTSEVLINPLWKWEFHAIKNYVPQTNNGSKWLGEHHFTERFQPPICCLHSLRGHRVRGT